MKKMMNFKRMILMAVCLLSMSLTYAQKPNVYMDYFWRPVKADANIIELLRNNFMQGMQSTNRIEITDVASKDALQIEEARRSDGTTTAGDDLDRMKVMTEEGANFLIQGRVAAIDWDIQKSSDGKTDYYTATCTYTVKVIDPSNGKVVLSKNFEHGNGIMGSILEDSQEAAYAKLCGQAVKAGKQLVEEAFKVQGTILEVASSKKDKATEVYISLGSDNGIAKGAYFDACIERKVAGRVSQKVIGQLEVINVEGGDLSLCKVKKGGEEIKVAMDGGQTLSIKSTTKPKSFLEKAAGAMDSL